MLERVFTDHPRSVGETYRQHQRVALGFAWRLAGAAAACAIHALIPALLQTHASRTITDLHSRMVAHRRGPQGSV
ncbi:DUF6356 family protein [Phenylobacterium sp.]|uniref:DUF6356 family protein n=1 Tax=Phenylobacterium sp. TaxID=1871053 RepID=UPI002FC81B7A